VSFSRESDQLLHWSDRTEPEVERGAVRLSKDCGKEFPLVRRSETRGGCVLANPEDPGRLDRIGEETPGLTFISRVSVLVSVPEAVAPLE